MTTLTLSSSFNFASDQDWDWVVSSATASSLIITNSVYKQTFLGGFAYDVNDIVSGTVSASNFFVNNALVYSITGMVSDATQLQVFANTIGDAQQTNAYVLQSNDTINGSMGNDTLLGYAGDDVITGGAGNDTIDGSIGTDSAIFSGDYAAASIQYSDASATFTITTIEGGTDTVTGVETLTFADQSVSASGLIIALTPADDYTPSILTAGRVSVNGSVSGNLESINDADWFAVPLTSGQPYSFKLDSGTSGGLYDPYLKLYDSRGVFLASADGGGAGFNSLLTYTAPESATYFMAASSGTNGSGIGTYVLSVASDAPVDPAPLITAFSPADGASDVIVTTTANAVITFSEAIQRGTGWIILESAAGVAVTGFDAATDARLAIVGSTLTINLTGTLDNATNYFITFAPGTIKDLAGNNYVGTTSYDFTTRAPTSEDLYLISSNATGVVANIGGGGASFSGDSRYFAFQSSSDNLVPDDTNGNVTSFYPEGSDIFVKDMQTGAVQRISTNSAGMQLTFTLADGTQYMAESHEATFSPNGRYVAFVTGANNLVDLHYSMPGGGTTVSVGNNSLDFNVDMTSEITSGDNNGTEDIYVKELSTGIIQLVSADSNGLAHSGNSWGSSFSPDGRYVLFQSNAYDMLDPWLFTGPQIYQKDLQTGALQLVSTNSSGLAANSGCNNPSFSGDSRYMLFESDASNLVQGSPQYIDQAYIKDLLTGTIQAVSTSSTGALANADTAGMTASMSADHRYVAFISAATNLGPLNDNGLSQVFVKDMLTGTVQLASANAAGEAGNDTSWMSEISADGRYVVFDSEASNLIDGDNNAGNYWGSGRDVFVKDLLTGAIQRVASHAQNPTFSADGLYVAVTSSDKLIPADKNYNALDVYRIANPFTATTSNSTESSTSYALTSQQTALTLTGIDDINATGNILDNVLTGNTGNNILTGNGGSDAFIFVANGNGIDTITDFSAGDSLTVLGAVFSGAIAAGDGGTVTANQVQLTSEGGTTTLYIGTDSTAGTDVQIQLTGTFAASAFASYGNTIAFNGTPVGSVSITGTATQGQTLTASNNLADIDGLGTIGYQWQAGGTAISGATGSNYLLTTTEVGKAISVVASYTDGHGTLETVISNSSANVSAVSVPATTSSTTTSRYTLLGTGANLMDFYLPYGNLTLDGQNIVFKGNSGIDSVYVGNAAGLSFDFTQAGLSTDQIYLSGNWADYSRSYSGSVVTLIRTNGGSETIKTISGDSLVFADGTVSVLNTLNFLKATVTEPVPDNNATSTAFPMAIAAGANNTVRAVVQDASGETIALARPGVAMIAKGGSGVDVVYVTAGANLDGTQLGLGQDKLYLTGNWADYNGTYAGSVVTLTRTIGTDTETVKFLGGSTSAYDSIVFADGTANSIDVLNYVKATAAAPTLNTTEVTPLGSGDIVTGTTAAESLNGTVTGDVIYGGGGADIINGGAGNDTIIITDAGTTASNSASIVFTSTANGTDTIIDFSAAAVASGGDILDFSAIANLADAVATGQTLMTDFAASNVFIFDGTPITITEAANAIATDVSVLATNGYIVLADSANHNAVTVYYSTDLAANGLETALVILSGVNITQLTAGNFLV